MKKKKKTVVITLSIMAVTILSMLIYNLSFNQEIITSSHTEKGSNNEMLAVLLETSYKSGKYQESTNNAWPEGYVLNKRLSKCENGGILDFNEENSRVSLKTKSSDRCYIYFDQPTPDVYIVTSNIPTSYGVQTTLSCDGSGATYNDKYQRIEVKSLSNKIGCTLNYTERTNKIYLNNYITELSGTEQGAGSVVNETFEMPNYNDATVLTQSDYGTVNQFYSASTSSTSGTAVTDAFLHNGTEWESQPGNMTSGKYYNISITIPTDGYYQLCYELSKGSTSNALFIYKGSSSISNFSYLYASSTVAKNGCVDLKKVTAGTTYRIIQKTQTTISTLKFNLKKSNTMDSVDTGYRYEGKNPNNYVWFNNELWRIIGVFDENTHGQRGETLVKVVKANSLMQITPLYENAVSFLSDYYYKGKNATDTEYCMLQKDSSLKRNSLCDYENTGIKDSYRLMIREAKWYYKKDASGSDLGEIYSLERQGNEHIGYVSLIYPSDYLYSATAKDKDRYSLEKNDTSYMNGWLFHESTQLLFGNMFIDMRFGSVGSEASHCDNGTSLYGGAELYRPALYLNENVYLISGSGTSTNPYVIGM